MSQARDTVTGVRTGGAGPLRTYGPTVVLMTTSNLVYNMLFIILGAIATQRHYDERQIGFVGSAFLIGQTIANLSGGWWVNRLDWRWVVMIASLGAVGFILGAVSLPFVPFLVCYGCAGAMTGLILSCVFCGMSRLGDPVRAYSLSLVSQCVVAGALIYAAQVWVVPHFGLGGLNMLLAVCFATGAAAGACLPRPPRRFAPGSPASEPTARDGGRTGEAASHRLSGVVALAGISIYFLGQTGVWAFLERIGASKGFSPAFIGTATALVLVLCALGGSAATFTGTRLGVIRPIVLAQAIFVASMAGLAFTSGRLPYFLALLTYASAWNYVLPYQMLIVSRFDAKGVLASMIPAFQSIGSSIGPAVVGTLVVGGFGYAGAYAMACATAMISLTIFVMVVGRRGAAAAVPA